ncbi:MAG TPA: hypothetical protein VFC45_07190 [Pseudolabrys sp.]|nr:hypothetical protein [Pseudolabrys sp.]
MIGKTPTNPQQPLSKLLLETIAVARKHGGTLVRLPRFRGCWTWPDCPMKRARNPAFVDVPKWWVTDNTARTLLRRGIATVTHVRGEGRPAAIHVGRSA